MTTRDVTIEIKQGSDVSPVAKCVQVAKSIMGMMALGIAAGQTVTISADGEDETQAIDSIEKYLGNK